MAAHLDQIALLVSQFEKFKDLNILAQWGVPNEYRFNNVFVINSSAVESLPSQNFGFIPSGKTKKCDTIRACLKPLKISDGDLQAMLNTMQGLGLAAIAKDSEFGVRAIVDGISDNEAGLILTQKDSQIPSTGFKSTDGRQYTTVEKIKPGVVFYETN